MKYWGGGVAQEDSWRPSEDEDCKAPDLILLRREPCYHVAIIIFVCVWGYNPNIRYSSAVKAGKDFNDHLSLYGGEN